MISVCVATYNGEKYLKEQLDSILVQLMIEDELVISDDGSTDRTLEIIRNYKDSRIHLINNEKKGLINNFENALKHAKGDIIFLSDQDDIWLPGKVEKMANLLESYDLAVSDCKIVNKEKKYISESFFRKFNSGKGFWKNFKKNTYLGCCMAFRKEVLQYVLPFPKNIAMHDIWIGLSVELNGNPIFLNEPLLLYRRHGSNVSPTGEVSKNSFFYKVRYRLDIFYFLLKRKLFHI